MDKLLAKLSEQTAALSKQHEVSMALSTSSDDIPTDRYNRTVEYVAATTSTIVPSADAELLRLKLELEAAKSKIARQEEELAHSQRAESDFGGYNPGRPV